MPDDSSEDGATASKKQSFANVARIMFSLCCLMVLTMVNNHRTQSAAASHFRQAQLRYEDVGGRLGRFRSYRALSSDFFESLIVMSALSTSDGDEELQSIYGSLVEMSAGSGAILSWHNSDESFESRTVAPSTLKFDSLREASRIAAGKLSAYSNSLVEPQLGESIRAAIEELISSSKYHPTKRFADYLREVLVPHIREIRTKRQWMTSWVVWKDPPTRGVSISGFNPDSGLDYDASDSNGSASVVQHLDAAHCATVLSLCQSDDDIQSFLRSALDQAYQEMVASRNESNDKKDLGLFGITLDSEQLVRLGGLLLLVCYVALFLSSSKLLKPQVNPSESTEQGLFPQFGSPSDPFGGPYRASLHDWIARLFYGFVLGFAPSLLFIGALTRFDTFHAWAQLSEAISLRGSEVITFEPRPTSMLELFVASRAPGFWGTVSDWSVSISLVGVLFLAVRITSQGPASDCHRGKFRKYARLVVILIVPLSALVVALLHRMNSPTRPGLNLLLILGPVLALLACEAIRVRSRYGFVICTVNLGLWMFCARGISLVPPGH